VSEELKEKTEVSEKVELSGQAKEVKGTVTTETYVPEYDKNIREGFLGRESQEKSDECILDRYREMMEHGEGIPDMTFDYGDRLKGMSFMDGGVKVVMPTREAVDEAEAENETPWIGGGFMSRRYAVKIIDVNYEEKTVTVSHKEAKAEYKGRVLADIRRALEEGRNPIVKARVKAMPVHYGRDTNKNQKRRQYSNLTATKKCTAAILEIEGLGINGWLTKDAYMDCYIPDLIPFMRVGDIVDVAVMMENEEPYRGKDGKGKPQPVFTCSRKDAVPSCWKNLKLKKGANIVVTCISKQDTAWTGVTADKNITYRCKYPYNSGNIGQVKVGKKYCGRIDEFDPEEHILNVSVTQECNSLEGA